MRNALPIRVYPNRPGLPSEPCIRRTMRALAVRHKGTAEYVPTGTSVRVESHGERYATVRPILRGVLASFTVNVPAGELL